MLTGRKEKKKAEGDEERIKEGRRTRNEEIVIGK